MANLFRAVMSLIAQPRRIERSLRGYAAERRWTHLVSPVMLCRNNKEAHLLNCNGEFHGLRRRPDQKDFAVRRQQFFDHHLKGAPAPKWMQKGVPFIDRDDEKERFGKAVNY